MDRAAAAVHARRRYKWSSTVAYAPSAEYISDAWEQIRKGQLPDEPPTYLLASPSMVDSSPAPEEQHSATIFTPYFRTGLDADENRSWKEQIRRHLRTDLRQVRAGDFRRLGHQPRRLLHPLRGSTSSAHAGDTRTACYSRTSCGPAASSRGPTSSPHRSTGSTCVANARIRPRGNRHPRMERRRGGPQTSRRARRTTAFQNRTTYAPFGTC